MVGNRIQGFGPGPRSHVCTFETLPLGPHHREKKFFDVRFFKVTFKHLPQPLKHHIPCLADPTTACFPFCLPEIVLFFFFGGGAPKIGFQ